jgi:hypothetical protein
MEALIILALFIVFAVLAALFGQDSRDDFTRDYKGLTHLSSPHH